MINFSLVDVKSISSNVPRSNFAEADLDQLADMILESGGIIRPLVVKATGVENYTVIDGHLEYYAAVRAKEKNPRQGEMVNAFVISPKIEDTVAKQATALRSLESSDENTVKPPVGTGNLEPRLANLELRYEKQINELKSEQVQERERLDDRLKQIESQIPKQIVPLAAFNTLSLTELTFRLKSAGFTNQTATKVAESVEKERKKKQFVSLSDVVERVKVTSGKRQVKGITSDKMVDIVDSWSRLLFF
ncbi:chromosome partitioning protein ParB [Iningainema tapete]|uniref:Chromosome partitioning protein ParB n=1 Tax=Iningainema tapete BLCC-T55 TaxID=2748662 RepID=A0A8J6XNX2_9CYAN|nr:chromosome partitioning protein ParB [Iningainema tapete]MBD2778583.1 chromosome partitioning protein ParB [Iningainema tapete BLCC-T55]